MRAISRRAFLEMGVGAAAGPLSGARARAAQPSRPSFPYGAGLSFLGENPSDVASSGLSAFISDVSAGEQIKQPDGSSRFVRSFDACARAITDQRRRLEAGSIPGAFLATKGSQIAEAHRTGRTAVFFQFQGCEPIGEALWRLDLFHALGLRVLQITHHHDNAWGGGAIEKHWSGLSTVGRAGVERLNALGIIPDLSHGSDLTALDVLRVSRRPVVVSHGAARAIVNNARCTSDAVIRGVARSGGMMGIFMMTFWLTNDPVPTVDALHRADQARHQRRGARCGRHRE
jgi:membrane dipeptidase